jgi:hypothetical protein
MRRFTPFYEEDAGATGSGSSGIVVGGGKIEFTPEQQAELDRIVADRLTRERKKAEKYADYDELKTKLTALEQAEADREKAKLTETERAQAKAAEAQKAVEAANAERDKALSTANQRLVNAEFKAVARDKNVPADRLAAALKLADLTGASVDDEGNVAGVTEAVEALIAANPYLAEVAQPKTIGSPSGGAVPANKTKDQRLAEAKALAEKNPTPQAIAAYTTLKRELSS